MRKNIFEAIFALLFIMSVPFWIVIGCSFHMYTCYSLPNLYLTNIHDMILWVATGIQQIGENKGMDLIIFMIGMILLGISRATEDYYNFDEIMAAPDIYTNDTYAPLTQQAE